MEIQGNEFVSEEEMQKLSQLMLRFVKSYEEKPSEQTDEEWLQNQFTMELQGLDSGAIAGQGREAMEAIRVYNENLDSLAEARAQGKLEEEWFAGRVMQLQAQNGMKNAEAAARMADLYNALEQDGTQIQLQEEDWNPGKLQMMAKTIGERAMLSGYQNAAVFAGYNGVLPYQSGMSSETQQTIIQALESGNDSALKAAAAGALKVASEKEIVKIVPVGIPVYVAANIACTSIENLKVSINVADGKTTEQKAAKQMASNSMAMYLNVAFEAAGREAGGKLLSWIPFVGKPVGQAVGAAVGRAAARVAGPVIEKKLEKSRHPVAQAAKSVLQNFSEAKEKIKGKVKSFAGKIKQKLLG